MCILLIKLPVVATTEPQRFNDDGLKWPLCWNFEMMTDGPKTRVSLLFPSSRNEEEEDSCFNSLCFILFLPNIIIVQLDAPKCNEEKEKRKRRRVRKVQGFECSSGEQWCLSLLGRPQHNFVPSPIPIKLIQIQVSKEVSSNLVQILIEHSARFHV